MKRSTLLLSLIAVASVMACGGNVLATLDVFLLVSALLAPVAILSLGWLGLNAQVGSPIVVERPPLFANFTIRGGTYEEDDATQSEQNIDADEETFNVTAYNEGDDIALQGYPKAGYNPHVNDVLTEIWNPKNGTQPDGWTARNFVITKRKRTRFGKRGLIYQLSVIRRSALDTSQVTAAT